MRGRLLYQAHGGRYLVQTPPMPPLTQPELDRVYALPYERYYHPMYEPMGGVPAIEEVEFSITHNRGCFGACNFCSLAFHQGRAITCRSEKSILAEAEKLTHLPHFKGYIHDVGGPTANFRLPSCEKQLRSRAVQGQKMSGADSLQASCRPTTPNTSPCFASCGRFRESNGSLSVRASGTIICWRTGTRAFLRSWCDITSAASSR